MKVGIEFCRFSRTHEGGKCQVAYNLLKGFYENGHIDSIICFCHNDLKEILLGIAPNVRIIIVPYFTKKGIIPTRLRAGKCLEQLIRKEKIDIFFFTDKFAPFVKTSCKSVLLAHDILTFYAADNREIDYSSRFYIYHKVLIFIDFALNDNIIAISDFDKNCMIKYLPGSRKKITRIYDPVVFSEYRGSRNRNFITAINIQHHHKNVITLIKAFNELKNDTCCDLILVGKKPKNVKDIEDFITTNNLESRVLLTGFVTEDKLEFIISKTRLYVNPSLFEGFGMTAVEMMGNKIPVICADNSAQREVTCGKARYYSPSKDEHELALAIREELEKNTDGKLLDEYAELVRTKYDYRTIASEYWDFFEHCITR